MQECNFCKGTGIILDKSRIYCYEPIQITLDEYKYFNDNDKLNDLIDKKFEISKLAMKSRLGIKERE